MKLMISKCWLYIYTNTHIYRHIHTSYLIIDKDTN